MQVNFKIRRYERMKKYFSMMVAVLFLFGVVGPGLAQQDSTTKAPIAEGAAKPAGAVKGDKSDASKKRQAVTPDKKKASEAPGISQGAAKPAGAVKGEKSEKSKKRQAQTPDKKKAAEAPAVGEGMAAPKK
jgi:hypothetical protein